MLLLIQEAPTAAELEAVEEGVEGEGAEEGAEGEGAEAPAAEAESAE